MSFSESATMILNQFDLTFKLAGDRAELTIVPIDPDELLGLARQRFDSASGRLVQALKANTREHGARLNRVAPRLSLP
jgi:hypothetical protein